MDLMATYSTEGKPMILSSRLRLVVLAAAAAGLSACTQSEIRLEPDFGSAITQDKAAQVADPEPHYAGVPAPGSDGARVAAAVRRYETGRVIQPAAVSASGNVAGYNTSAGTAGDVGTGGGASTSIAPN